MTSRTGRSPGSTRRPPARKRKPLAAVAGFSTDMSTIYYRTATGFYESHDGVQSVAGVLPDGSVQPEAQPAGLPTGDAK